MITEPELAGEPDGEPASDMLSAGGHGAPWPRASVTRRWRRLPLPRSAADARPAHGAGDEPPPRRPWRPRPEGRRTRLIWSLIGVVTASAVWTAVLLLTGHGDTHRPDLHGYRIAGNPCTSHDLRPLSERFGGGFLQGIPVITKGPGLDHVSCTMTTELAGNDGWQTDYTITLTVDLHKKADVSAEFADISHVIVPDPTAADSGDFLFMSDSPEVTRPLAGIGDKAYTIYGTARQALTVLHGGAVFSLSVDGIRQWDGAGRPPLNADGSPISSAPADTTALRPALTASLRNLMSALSH